jgi:anaphase-promoting complex subunit 1
MTYDENISRINLRAFLDALCLALAAVMAGSGDLDVLRRLRRLHGRRHDEANYGGHMASHMAIGMLFMSGGQYTIGTSPLATAALFCATYPKFPSTPADNNFHLQALRHLWVLAADNRCLVPRSVDTYRPSLVVIKVFLRSDASKSGIQMLAPCLLPDLNTIASIETVSPGFQHVTLDFAARPDLFQQFQQNPMIFVVGNPIATAYRTPFEQGLARVVKADNGGGGQRRSVARAVQECLQTSYVEEELGTSEGLSRCIFTNFRCDSSIYLSNWHYRESSRYQMWFAS